MDLQTIVPSGVKVSIGDGSIEVRGLSFKAIAALMQRFPKLVSLFNGQVFEIADLIATAPDLCAAAMAASVGKLGDTEAEAFFSDLELETQMQIIDVIRARSFGPFVTKALSSLLSSQAGLEAAPASASNGSAVPSPLPLNS